MVLHRHFCCLHLHYVNVASCQRRQSIFITDIVKPYLFRCHCSHNVLMETVHQIHCPALTGDRFQFFTFGGGTECEYAFYFLHCTIMNTLLFYYMCTILCNLLCTDMCTKLCTNMYAILCNMLCTDVCNKLCTICAQYFVLKCALSCVHYTV